MRWLLLIDSIGSNYLHVKCCESETDERILKGSNRGLGVALSLTFKHPDVLVVVRWRAQTGPAQVFVSLRGDRFAHGNTWTDRYRM